MLNKFISEKPRSIDEIREELNALIKERLSPLEIVGVEFKSKIDNLETIKESGANGYSVNRLYVKLLTKISRPDKTEEDILINIDKDFRWYCGNKNVRIDEDVSLWLMNCLSAVIDRDRDYNITLEKSEKNPNEHFYRIVDRDFYQDLRVYYDQYLESKKKAS